MASIDRNDPSSGPLLSASTILILSGFLIGLTIGKIVAADLSPYILACGLSGFLAFIAFDTAAHRRELQRQLAEKEVMERRLEKHMLSVSSFRLETPEPPPVPDLSPSDSQQELVLS